MWMIIVFTLLGALALAILLAFFLSGGARGARPGRLPGGMAPPEPRGEAPPPADDRGRDRSV